MDYERIERNREGYIKPGYETLENIACILEGNVGPLRNISNCIEMKMKHPYVNKELRDTLEVSNNTVKHVYSVLNDAYQMILRDSVNYRSRCLELEQENEKLKKKWSFAKRKLCVKTVDLVPDLRVVLTKEFDAEYDTWEDEVFFSIYSGEKNVEVYGEPGAWFIVQDDNYLLTENCFLPEEGSVQEDCEHFLEDNKSSKNK
jgi:hypothetical protein